MSIEPTEATSIKVNRRKIDSLEVFDVTADELDQLQSGGSTSTIFNFAIATGSFGLSSLLSLLTLKFNSDREYLTFLSVTVIALLACTILFAVWTKMRGTRQKVIDKIRGRVDYVGSEENDDPTAK